VPTAASNGLGVEEVCLPATEASLVAVLQAMEEALEVVRAALTVA